MAGARSGATSRPAVPSTGRGSRSRSWHPGSWPRRRWRPRRPLTGSAGAATCWASRRASPGPSPRWRRGSTLPFGTLRRAVPASRCTGSWARSAASVPAYASGIDPKLAPGIIEASREQGFRAFKMKIGFGREADLQALEAAHGTLRAGRALHGGRQPALGPGRGLRHGPGDGRSRPRLARGAARGRPALGRMARRGRGGRAALGRREPARRDPTSPRRWRAAPSPIFSPTPASGAASRAACPWRGPPSPPVSPTAPTIWAGRWASWPPTHLLAAAGGQGLLEVDVQENPLRSELCGPFLKLEGGEALLPTGPGLGAEPDAGVMARYQVQHGAAKAG